MAISRSGEYSWCLGWPILAALLRVEADRSHLTVKLERSMFGGVEPGASGALSSKSRLEWTIRIEVRRGEEAKV
jgi:hypothetical protein